MDDGTIFASALEIGRRVEKGTLDPLELTEAYLQRIDEIDPERAIYVRTTPERARAEARAARDRAKAGLRRSPLDGVPISWKDLYDTAGEATEAGSRLLEGRVPERDAVALARAARAGLICLGKTNTSEFAFSGLGVNPSTGTPANPFDDRLARCPGGSSSGAGVSTARGLCAAGIGSDTGGSVRIPAAWNGLVGLKTTIGLIPTEGVVPLSRSFDTVGPLTRDVADANALAAVMAATKPADLAGASVAGRAFLAPDGTPMSGTEPEIAARFEATLEILTAAGARVERAEIPEFDAALELGSHSQVLSVEGYSEWRELIEAAPDKAFHQIVERFRLGAEVAAPTLVADMRALTETQARYRARVAGYDAVIMPTTPSTPPEIAPLLSDDDAYLRMNLHALRNTRLGNLMAISALTLPNGLTPEGLPTGLMLFGRPMGEGALLRLGAAIETLLVQ